MEDGDGNENENEDEIIHPIQRKPSRLVYLETSAQKLDIRAHQRTYQGAYVRTCLGTLSFSLIVLKLFSKEFFPIGLVFNCYGLLLCLISHLRSTDIDLYFINFGDSDWKLKYEVGEIENDGSVDHYFKTSGNYVIWLTLISFFCYLALFILLLTV
ncbi:hypothetical protein CANARDRAFT_202869 [[Candida] arabinofermentans NRRL YB-2248]|uniref:Uncharacterized protein n=1 Tax=[Candida] arabinofermentans NRRL YB-2248 TaxID=983967 RepID=A0A1E4SVV5_9ASCO|nr:hypothetical protein CANARDRAFT_202869 [[Candida] arabinofermentans NRRL YB-2248]